MKKINFSNIGDYISVDCIDHAGPQSDVKGLVIVREMFEKSALDML
jgi:hypothetical protein